VPSPAFDRPHTCGRARAIVEATAHYDDAKLLARVSRGLSGAMKGIDIKDLTENQKLQTRGV
jgi:pyridoxal 5'-phosphate synthase pdxS subunit